MTPSLEVAPEVARTRTKLTRAVARGDQTRAAVLRGELMRLHRRALRRALAVDDSEAAAYINAELAADLGPLLPSASQCARALILDKTREIARLFIGAMGPLALERVQARPERFLATVESADGVVSVSRLLKNEEEVEALYRELISTVWPISIHHDIETALVARLEAITDSIDTVAAGGAA